MVTNNSTNSYATSSIIVSATPGEGNYTTIASALAAAVSGDNIFIKPGTYTENLTIKNGVNFFSYGNATIIGNLTDGGVGVDCNFYNINFQTNLDYILTSSGAGSINFIDCFFNATNHTLFSLSNGLGNIFCYECTSSISSTFTLIDLTSGDFWSYYSQFASDTASSIAGLFLAQQSIIAVPLSASGTGIISLYNNQLGGFPGVLNQTPITLSGTSTCNCYDNYISSGTSSAISVGAGCSAKIVDNSIDSTNANVITGAGTISSTGNSFVGSSSGNNVTTQIPLTFNAGLLQTAPPSSNTATTGFGSLAVGTALQNTLGYDILVNVSIVATVATGATIVLGVGPTNTPTTNAVTASFSAGLTQSFTAIVPNGYYVLVNTTGTITVGSITTQVCPL